MQLSASWRPTRAEEPQKKAPLHSRPDSRSDPTGSCNFLVRALTQRTPYSPRCRRRQGQLRGQTPGVEQDLGRP